LFWKWSYCSQGGFHGVPGFWDFSDTIVVFVSDGDLIKIHHMFMGPRMTCISGALGCCFDDVSYDGILFQRVIKDLPASRLHKQLAKLKLLLKHFKWLVVDNSDVMLFTTILQNAK